MNAVLALKLSLVPLLIYLVTLAGRRWGPAVRLAVRLSHRRRPDPVCLDARAGRRLRRARGRGHLAGGRRHPRVQPGICLGLDALRGGRLDGARAAGLGALAVHLAVRRLLARPANPVPVQPEAKA
jgi:hypothetical protein